MTPDTSPAPVFTIPCSTPQRFTVGATTVDAIAATDTSTGFALVTLVGTGAHGYAYEWDAGGNLAMTADTVSLGESTATFAIASAGTDVIIASVFGTPSPAGTAMLPRANDMTMRAPIKMHGDIGAMVPLAASGTSASFGFVSTDAAGEVQAWALAASGEYTGGPFTIVPAAMSGNSVTIAPAGTGYLMTWLATPASPNELDIALLDDQFAIVKGPIAVNTAGTGFDPIRPHAAWSASTNTVAVSWHEKDINGDDNIWFASADANLAPIRSATQIAVKSYDVRLASDGTSYFLAYNDYSTGSDRIQAQQLDAHGARTPVGVTSTGGSPKQWAMVARAHQAVLVWTETGGTGPDLWLQAMCP